MKWALTSLVVVAAGYRTLAAERPPFGHWSANELRA